MPKRIPSTEFDAISAVVAQIPNGAALDDVARALQPRPARRTLQRRLALLVERGVLTQQGHGRGSRYWLCPATNSPLPTKEEPLASDGSDTQQESVVPLSPAGQEIRDRMHTPLPLRKRVGYNRDFLDRYRPNTSFYLSASQRQQLVAMGRQPLGELPPGTYIRKVFDRLLIDLSWNSSRLEGNTYSLLETERLLALGESADGKFVRESQMILNHKAAIELLVDQVDVIGFTPYTIRNLHALLADGLLESSASCGKVRSVPVGITGTAFTPLNNPQLLEECFSQLLVKAEAIMDPFEQAFFAMVHLPYLQPFEDVNKRVSRLAANIPLIKHDYSPISFVDVPTKEYTKAILGVYELNRIDYLRDLFMWAYERSCGHYADVQQFLGEPNPFRLRYRIALSECIQHVVKHGQGKVDAVAFIRTTAASSMPVNDRARFLEMVETELSGLHEGNIARHRIRPSEYWAWRATWQ